jgi:predicted amidohydrolase
MPPTAPTLRVAAVQMTVTPNIDTNAQQLCEQVAYCAARGAQLVLFPETALSDYSPALKRQRQPSEWRDIQRGLHALADAAGQARCWVVVGSDAWTTDGWVNRAYVLNAQGATAATYDKVHLTPDDWHYYQPGQQPTLFDLDGVPVGLQICYDVRFPEGYRQLLHRGARVIVQGFYGAGGDTWKVPIMNSHIRARAAESGCFVVAANVSGPLQIVQSMIVDPLGLVLAQANQDLPEVLFADLDLGRVDQSIIRRDYLERYR